MLLPSMKQTVSRREKAHENILFLILAAAVVLTGPVFAENESTYTPVGLLDGAGLPAASFAVNLQKEADAWRFNIATAMDLPLSHPGFGNGSILTADGILFIPHVYLMDSNGQVARNNAVHMRRDSSWRFTLYGITDLDADNTSTNDSDTNTTVCTTNTADVAGTWEFSFTKSHNITNSGTEFGNTTEMTPNDAVNITLTLEQNDEDVTGTGTGTDEFYTLSRQIAGDPFSYSLLTGYTNGSMSLTSGHVASGNGTMGGDYYADAEDLNEIETGSLTATEQYAPDTASADGTACRPYLRKRS